MYKITISIKSTIDTEICIVTGISKYENVKQIYKKHLNTPPSWWGISIMYMYNPSDCGQYCGLERGHPYERAGCNDLSGHRYRSGGNSLCGGKDLDPAQYRRSACVRC